MHHVYRFMEFPWQPCQVVKFSISPDFPFCHSCTQDGSCLLLPYTLCAEVQSAENPIALGEVGDLVGSGGGEGAVCELWGLSKGKDMTSRWQ